MKKRRFSVEQMVGVLKQAELGVPVAEVIRKAGISASFCPLRAAEVDDTAHKSALNRPS